jgi:hypothetical protein
MRRFLDDDSLIDSGNDLQLTTVAGHQQPSASKVHQNYVKQDIY